MRSSRIGLFTLGALVLATASSFTAWSQAAQDPIPAAQAVVQAACALGTEDYQFTGNKSCKKCHLNVEKAWQETKHAKAFDTLKPGNAKEAKEKAKLDPAKDYSKDEVCVACHVVGFKQPGGYAIPDPADEKAVKAAAKMENVGCENCHGPGGKYSEVFEEIAKSGRKYKVDELYAVGLKKVEAATCTACHNEKGPTHTGEAFDFEKMKEKGVHAHEPLKQREG